MVPRCVGRTVTASLLIAFASTLAAQTASPSFELKRDTYTSVTTAADVQTLATGDFNNDGKPDLIVAGGATSTTLTFRAGNGDGTFQAPQTIGVANNSHVAGIAAADVNGDGKLDLIVATANIASRTGGFEVWLGTGTGTFQPPLIYTTPAEPTSLAIGDFNSDGLPDIALGDTAGDVEIWNNDGNGAFALSKTVRVNTIDDAVMVKVGKFDGTSNDSIAAFGEYLSVLWNDGHENFTLARLNIPQWENADINVGDLNQDGRDDILFSYECPSTPNSTGTGYVACDGIDVYYGEGNQTFIHRNLVKGQGVPNMPSFPWAADVNGDGIADLVAEEYPGGGSDDPGSGLYVWLGQPDGSYSQTPLFYHPSNHGDGALIPGDFNRDGMIDFVQTLPFDQEIEVYTNGGRRAPCATLKVDHTVTECEPVDHTWTPTSTVSSRSSYSNFTFLGNTYDGTSSVTSLQLYDNGKLIAKSDISTDWEFNTVESPGLHFFVTKAWDAAGISYRTDRTIHIYNGTPGPACAAAQNSASVCLASGLSSVSPVQILGNGWTLNVPTAAQLYIDGKLVVDDKGCDASGNNCNGGTSYVDTTQSLSSGTHSLVFKLWDSKGNSYQAQETVNVP